MSVPVRLLPAALLSLLLAACQGTATPTPTTTPPPAPSTTAVSAPTPTIRTESPGTPPATSPLASLVRPLGSAHVLPEPDEESAPPVAVSIAAIGVDAAPVVDVGVLPNGEMEIPGARQVGWYRYGPVPGEAGSAVLAAHIAFDGRDGVFRRLADLDTGAVVEVTFADGARERFVVTERAQYPKEGLPFDRVFSKDGGPVLTLVTCGGAFDRGARSYQDNVVVYAVPVEVVGR